MRKILFGVILLCVVSPGRARADAMDDYRALSEKNRQQNLDLLDRYKKGEISAEDVEKEWEKMDASQRDAAKRVEEDWKKNPKPAKKPEPKKPAPKPAPAAKPEPPKKAPEPEKAQDMERYDRIEELKRLRDRIDNHLRELEVEEPEGQPDEQELQFWKESRDAEYAEWRDWLKEVDAELEKLGANEEQGEDLEEKGANPPAPPVPPDKVPSTADMERDTIAQAVTDVRGRMQSGEEILEAGLKQRHTEAGIQDRSVVEANAAEVREVWRQVKNGFYLPHLAALEETARNMAGGEPAPRKPFEKWLEGLNEWRKTEYEIQLHLGHVTDLTAGLAGIRQMIALGVENKEHPYPQQEKETIRELEKEKAEVLKLAQRRHFGAFKP